MIDGELTGYMWALTEMSSWWIIGTKELGRQLWLEIEIWSLVMDGECPQASLNTSSYPSRAQDGSCLNMCGFGLPDILNLVKLSASCPLQSKPGCVIHLYFILGLESTCSYHPSSIQIPRTQVKKLSETCGVKWLGQVELMIPWQGTFHFQCYYSMLTYDKLHILQEYNLLNPDIYIHMRIMNLSQKSPHAPW
jgi:hypothetical protein